MTEIFMQTVSRAWAVRNCQCFGVMEPDEWPVVLSGEIAGADAKKKDTPKALLSHASQRGTFPFPLTGCSGNYILS